MEQHLCVHPSEEALLVEQTEELVCGGGGQGGGEQLSEQLYTTIQLRGA